MGKSLVIKGADFSDCCLNIVKTTVLLDSSGSELDSWPTKSSETPGGCYYTVHTNDNKIYRNSGYGGGATNKIVNDGYNYVAIKTICATGYINQNIAGMVILGFLDADEKILGGFVTASTVEQIGNTSMLTPIGVVTEHEEFVMEVPRNTKYIVTTYNSMSDSPFANDNYYLKLIK